MAIRCCTKDCPRRSPRCHADCPDYARESAEHRAEQERIREIKAKEYSDYYYRNRVLKSINKSTHARKKSYY